MKNVLNWADGFVCDGSVEAPFKMTLFCPQEILKQQSLRMFELVQKHPPHWPPFVPPTKPEVTTTGAGAGRRGRTIRAAEQNNHGATRGFPKRRAVATWSNALFGQIIRQAPDHGQHRYIYFQSDKILWGTHSREVRVCGFKRTKSGTSLDSKLFNFYFLFLQNLLNLLTSYLKWKKNLKSWVYERSCGDPSEHWTYCWYYCIDFSRTAMLAPKCLNHR